MKKLLCAIRITLPLCLFGGTGIVHAMTGTATANPDAGASLSTDANASQGAAPANRREGSADFGSPVDDAGLDEVRGGFDLGDGLQASLGIEQVAYVNGKLVTSTNISIPNIAQITQQQALALAAALSNLNVVVQNGAGNSVGSSAATQNNVATMPSQGSSGGDITLASTGQAAVAATPTQGASGSATTPISATQVSSIPVASMSPTNAGASSGTATVSLPGLSSGLATVIQNSLNNQSIRTLTTLNISVNTLQALRNMNLQNTLQSAQMLSLGH